MAEFLKRHAKQPDGGDSVPQAQRCPLSGKFAATTEFLSRVEWAPGEPRETGTILLCVDAGRWKAWLNDRDAGLSGWLSADTLTGLLDGIEAGLRSGGIEWRKVQKTGFRGRRSG